MSIAPLRPYRLVCVLDMLTKFLQSNCNVTLCRFEVSGLSVAGRILSVLYAAAAAKRRVDSTGQTCSVSPVIILQCAERIRPEV